MTRITADPVGSRERPGRWLRVALDGRHPWGELLIGPVDRTACAMSYRLTVYPPGITAVERRALVAGRRWPAAGAVLGLAATMLFGRLIDGWLALGAGAALFAAGFVVAGAIAGGVRRRVIRMRATVIRTLGHREVLGDLPELERAATRLLALDRLAESEELTPVEYEFLWGGIYQELGALARR